MVRTCKASHCWTFRIRMAVRIYGASICHRSASNVAPDHSGRANDSKAPTKSTRQTALIQSIYRLPYKVSFSSISCLTVWAPGAGRVMCTMRELILWSAYSIRTHKFMKRSKSRPLRCNDVAPAHCLAWISGARCRHNVCLSHTSFILSNIFTSTHFMHGETKHFGWSRTHGIPYMKLFWFPFIFMLHLRPVLSHTLQYREVQ